MFDRVRRLISEIIGRWSVYDLNIERARTALSTIDATKPDYAFWDLFRHGKKKGYYLASLFSKRIEKIFSNWVFGSGFDLVTGDLYTDKLLIDFCKQLSTGSDHDSLVMQIYENSLGLGDQYPIVNADLSFSVPTPDIVKWTTNELSPTELVSVELISRTLKYQISDLYTTTKRTITVKQLGKIISLTEYDNLIGEIPIVHVTNGQGANEQFGHSIHEALLPLYDLYDDTQLKQAAGAKILGNPILAFTGLKNMKQVRDANQPSAIETYIDKDGRTIVRDQFKVDQNSVLLIGEGGDAKFLAPPIGFTNDTRNTLESLFLLLIYHVGIPAFVWGAEMASARASSETQLGQWVHDIEGIQQNVSVWLVKLAKIWLKYKALSDHKIKLDLPISTKWKPLVTVDENIILKRLQFAKDHGLITSETCLRLLQLVDNPKEESELGSKEAKIAEAASMKAKQTDPGSVKGGSSKVEQFETIDVVSTPIQLLPDLLNSNNAKLPDMEKFVLAIKELKSDLLGMGR